MRINIQFTEPPIFIHSITLTKDHENAGNHLAHDKVVTLIGDCRDAWFTQLGFPNCLIETNIGIVNSDLALMYLNEAFSGETLTIELALADVNRYGGDMMMRAIRTHDEEEIFRAKSGFVFYNYEQKCITPRPAAFNASLNLT